MLCLLPTVSKVVRGAAGTEKNMGEIVQSEVDKMDANRELQTQLRCALLSALERTSAYTVLWNLCELQRIPRMCGSGQRHQATRPCIDIRASF